MNRVILNDGKNKGEIQINHLIQRRKKIVENLEKGRVALKDFLRREVDMEDLTPLLKTPSGAKAKEYVLNLWLLKTGIDMPVLNVPLTTALAIPAEVEVLLNAFEALSSLNSKDPSRYWSEENGQFLPLEVAKDERDKIIERNRVYVKKGASTELAMFAHQFVELINYSNRLQAGDTLPSTIRSIHPYLVPILEYRNIQNGAKFSSGYHEYRIKPNVFTEKGSSYLAFDELLMGEQIERFSSFF